MRRPNNYPKNGNGQRKGCSNPKRNKTTNRKVGKGTDNRKSPNIKDEDFEGQKNDRNDPSWYSHIKEMKDAVGSLFFSRPSGVPFHQIPTGAEADLGLSTAQYDFATAGILTLTTASAFGTDAGQNSPINVAAQSISAYIRSKSSANRKWDPNDMMTYLIAISEAFACIMHLERVYGISRRYIPQNKYFPEELLKAMRVDPASVQANYLQFAAGINLIISKMGAFAVPGDMDFFKRKVFMYQNYYIDSENPRDQIYAFVPAGFYKYTIDSAYPEAYLKFEPLPANATVNDLLTYANDLVATLWTAEDAAIMCGDIIKAYGQDIIQLVLMPNEYISLPVVMDDKLRYQIRNATIINEYPGYPLHQDATKAYLEWDSEMFVPGATTFHDSWASANALLNSGAVVLTSNNVSPDSDEIMESTRLTVMTDDPDIGSDGVHATLIIGTEVVVKVNTYIIRRNRSTGAITTTSQAYLSSWSKFSTNQLLALSQFRWHPSIYMFSTSPTASDWASSGVFIGVFNELDSISQVTPELLYNMHEVAMMSMLAAPSIALLK